MAYIWGRHAVREALASGRRLQKIFVARGAKQTGNLGEIVEVAHARQLPVIVVPNEALDRMAEGGNHQGVVADAEAFHYAEVEDLLTNSAAEPALLLMLDHISDPQNFGTLIRTAEAIGAHGIVIPRERAVGITPAVEKASAGAIEHLPVAQVVNLARTIDFLKERGVWAVGLDATGTDRYDQVDYDMPLVLVVGSEGRGLSRLVREKCDLLVKLPMRGKVASLNAAVAGSIVLYEVLRKRS